MDAAADNMEEDLEVPMAAGLGLFRRAARSSSLPVSFHEALSARCVSSGMLFGDIVV